MTCHNGVPVVGYFDRCLFKPHAALSHGRLSDADAEGAMVAGLVAVLEVGSALSFANSATFVARAVCNCSLKWLLVAVSC